MDDKHMTMWTRSMQVSFQQVHTYAADLKRQQSRVSEMFWDRKAKTFHLRFIINLAKTFSCKSTWEQAQKAKENIFISDGWQHKKSTHDLAKFERSDVLCVLQICFKIMCHCKLNILRTWWDLLYFFSHCYKVVYIVNGFMKKTKVQLHTPPSCWDKSFLVCLSDLS